MSHPAVQQLPYLSAVFREVLCEFQPDEIAVLGCSAGNGFDHIPPSTKRIVGIDINPQYVDVARRRHGDRLPGLDLVCGDILECSIAAHSIDLVHGALIFEYVDAAAVMERIATWLRPGGVLSIVLQLSSPHSGTVTATPFDSLRSLEAKMKLVRPALIEDLAAGRGLRPIRARVDTLPTGKAFHVAVYALAGTGRGCA
jgi:SAM-dependent methyltransferase